jgi:acyl carrier protein
VTRDALRREVLGALAEIAPEADPATLRGAVPLRHQLDLDSMDFLNLLVAVHQRTGVEIPEADYGKLASLDQIVAYLEVHEPRGRD